MKGDEQTYKRNGRRESRPTLPAEGVPVESWTGSEPVVVGLGAGDAPPARRHVVQRDRFLLLRLVPYQHSIGNLVDQPLRRQVIPAAHAEHALDAELSGAAHVVHLVRAEVQQRREQQDIRVDAPEYVGDLVRRRHRPLDTRGTAR